MRFGGVKPGHFKNTASAQPQHMPPPAIVKLAMSQHIGAPCKPTVKVGDFVKLGQPVAENPEALSVPIHASVSGRVIGIEDMVMPNGTNTRALLLESDGLMEPWERIEPPKVEDTASFLAAVRASGLVGLGGAGFPTYQKLKLPPSAKVDTLVINGAECEPFLTTDHYALLHESELLLEGIELVQKYTGVAKVKLCIEDNKPDAIEFYQKLAPQRPDFDVVPLPSVYPRGAEKLTVYYATGRIIGEGKLPSDAGAMVMNVNSLVFLARYLRTGMPLVSKMLTVDGSAVKKPGIAVVPIGTPIGEVFAFMGGYSEEPGVVIMGGPMMGISVCDDSFPVLKNNNGLLALTVAQSTQPIETACIHCGRCVNHCPLHLSPVLIEQAYQRRDYPTLKKLKANLCMECGCCSYICPAKRDLTLLNRLTKAFMREEQRKESAAK